MDNQKLLRLIPLVKACLWLFLIGMIIAFLLYFKGILMPFIYAVFVAFLVHEMVLLTGRIKIGGQALPTWFRSVLVIAILLSTVFLIVEIVIANADQIIQKAPEYEKTFGSLVTQLGTLTGAEDISKDLREQVNEMNVRALVSQLFSSFSAFLGNLFMVIIYGIFMLLERRVLPNKIEAIVTDQEQRGEVEAILKRIGDSVRQYISIKTFVSLLTGGLAYIVLLLFGVDFPVLWAFLIFLLNYIPYLGSLIATLLPTFLAIFQFESLAMGFWVFLSIQSIQTLVGTFIEPRFAGRTLNLSPTIVIFSLALWGVLWGIAGMAIAVPVSSILVIILSEFPGTRNAAILLSERGSFDHNLSEY